MQLQVVKPEFSLNSSTPEHRFSIIRKYYLTKEIKTCLQNDLAQGKTKLKNNIQIIPLLCSEPHKGFPCQLSQSLPWPRQPVMPHSVTSVLLCPPLPVCLTHSTPASLLFFKYIRCNPPVRPSQTMFAAWKVLPHVIYMVISHLFQIFAQISSLQRVLP